MKILFIENRYATRVYTHIANRLEREGNEIHWLIQNPVFSPKSGNIHHLPFPKNTFKSIPPTSDYSWLAKTDRGIRHFGLNCSHYPHYDRHIQSVIDSTKPDLIVGEATEFHELLAIKHAKRAGITYLSPNATRYPADRLAFFTYDSLTPLGGDRTSLSDADADLMLDAIRSRAIIPSYMRPAPKPGRLRSPKSLMDKARITLGWVRGERFVTPSPLRKIVLTVSQKYSRRLWDRYCNKNIERWHSLIASKKPWALYALQMQPEGNIDVWGQPWNNQTDIIAKAARSLEAIGANLVVKPNPKSKYELSRELLRVVREHSNIIALPHSSQMANVFPHATIVLTVTGTILMESIFAQKPVASLGTHEMARYPGVRSILQPEDIANALFDAVEGRHAPASQTECRHLLQTLHSSSYPATVWDPISQSHMATSENIESLINAFKDVISIHISNNKAPCQSDTQPNPTTPENQTPPTY